MADPVPRASHARNPGRGPKVKMKDEEAGFDRRGASRPEGQPLAISGITEARENIFFRQVREFVEDLFMGHAGGQIVEHVVDGNAHPPDARFSASFPRVYGDNAFVFHQSLTGAMLSYTNIRQQLRFKKSRMVLLRQSLIDRQQDGQRQAAPTRQMHIDAIHSGDLLVMMDLIEQSR